MRSYAWFGMCNVTKSLPNQMPCSLQMLLPHGFAVRVTLWQWFVSVLWAAGVDATLGSSRAVVVSTLLANGSSNNTTMESADWASAHTMYQNDLCILPRESLRKRVQLGTLQFRMFFIRILMINICIFCRVCAGPVTRFVPMDVAFSGWIRFLFKDLLCFSSAKDFMYLFGYHMFCVQSVLMFWPCGPLFGVH